MKKILVFAATALFAAGPAFTMEMESDEGAMHDEGTMQKMEDTSKAGVEKTKNAFTKDLSEKDIQEAQTKLHEAGFYNGEIDGKIGGDTVAAIKKYQESNGLKVNGELDQETANSMGIVTKQAQEEAEKDLEKAQKQEDKELKEDIEESN